MTGFDDDDFEELAPRAKATVSSPVAFGTCCVRGGTEKVTLTFAPEAIARLDGWPRFAVAWSPKQMALRIRADAQGRFEACRTPLGGRHMLRVDLPPELVHVPKLREPAPHTYGEDGVTLYVIAPPRPSGRSPGRPS
ncbi:hypothetical protein M446_4150 [Methylobacterium sp. 4-46]|uniref:hypothetical protein n=1 Tax=Methylobacterium sp. (strain 4-46) TaxID=426117 RepID=UPI000165C91E|nr:hypothetical protein [Methylobacterium sp. 4-46]ACA18507.1 hypothetical protein M446_4150 [Methylobacterium sp. 4-46]